MRGLIKPLLISMGLIAFIVAGFFLFAMPIFHTFSFKKRQVDAQRLLEKVYQAELSYFSKHGCFNDNPEIIGFVPNSRRKDYAWKIIRADCKSFLARAWANIDDDDYLDIWEISEAERWLPLHVFDDKTDTGREIDPMWPFPTNQSDEILVE